jgi:hypothetical protein
MEPQKSPLEKLKIQEERLKARIQKLDALEKTKARKKALHLKILIGGYYLEQAQKKGTLETLKADVGRALKRESDKALLEQL